MRDAHHVLGDAHEALARQRHDALAALEVAHGERRGEARRAAGRQHVVRADPVVADRDRRARADEHGAADDLPRQAGRPARHHLDVLRRERVDGGDPCSRSSTRIAAALRASARRARAALATEADALGHQARRPLRPARARSSPARPSRRRCRARPGPAGRRRRGRRRPSRRPGSRPRSARPRCRSRPAAHEALGGGDVGVAGPHDLVDRRDRPRAVGERRDRLRAADAVDVLLDARPPRSRRPPPGSSRACAAA